MPRLFAAISPPDDVRDALALCRGGLEGARWVDPADYHVTLRFIGDVDARVGDRVAGELDAINAPAFELELDGFGSFGNKAPHAVHLKVKPSAELVALNGACEAACRRVGLAPETRNFAPHITIARLRGIRSREAAAWLDARQYVGPRTFPVRSFGLFTARPGGGGPYGEAVRFPLDD